MKSFILMFLLFNGLALGAEIKNSKVTWTAIGNPGFLQIDGKGGYVQGELLEKDGKISGELICELKSFKTGIKTRDKHMRNDYLQVKKHPTAKLVLKDVLVGPKFDFVGKLTLSGVTKDVKGKGKLKRVGSDNIITAKMNVILTNFNIDIPSYLGVTVAENVDIEVMLVY